MSYRPQKQVKKILAPLSTSKYLPLTRNLKAKGFQRMKVLLKRDFTLASNSDSLCQSGFSQGSRDTTSHRTRLFYSNLPIYSCGRSWGRGMKVWSGYWRISSHQAVNQRAGLSSHHQDYKEELGEASVEPLSCGSAAMHLVVGLMLQLGIGAKSKEEMLDADQETARTGRNSLDTTAAIHLLN